MSNRKKEIVTICMNEIALFMGFQIEESAIGTCFRTGCHINPRIHNLYNISLRIAEKIEEVEDEND